MKWLYTVAIWWYGAMIRMAALFSGKARLWVEGRKGLFALLEKAIPNKDKWIWIHAASLGEFEQGRPLLEYIRARHPDTAILLTFFSPSGYLVRKAYPSADLVTYMPLDLPAHARRFVSTVRPVAAIFIKYEIWYHHLRCLEELNIPTFLISAHLRAEQIYFRSWGGFLLQRLQRLRRIFTQTAGSAAMLRERRFENVLHTGDTRLDRVLEIAHAPGDYGWLSSCLGDGPVLVAGSTWPEDEAHLLPALRAMNLRSIIAPHEISPKRIKELMAALPEASTLSALRQRPQQVRHVIVDTMGELAFLYALGAIAYVGGGFGKGIHNVLEPVAHGIPVLIGPCHERFAEAVHLVEAGVVYPVATTGDLEYAIRENLTRERQSAVSEAIRQYIAENRGATERIYREIRDVL